VDLTCTLAGLLSVCTIPYSIALDTGGSGSYATRQLSSLSDVLQYNVYTDPARSIVWGDGSGATATINDGVSFSNLLGGVRTANHPAYGRIPANQAVDEGIYSDTLTVTVTY
jgi:spore coat protein U-like protein